MLILGSIRNSVQEQAKERGAKKQHHQQQPHYTDLERAERRKHIRYAYTPRKMHSFLGRSGGNKSKRTTRKTKHKNLLRFARWQQMLLTSCPLVNEACAAAFVTLRPRRNAQCSSPQKEQKKRCNSPAAASIFGAFPPNSKG